MDELEPIKPKLPRLKVGLTVLIIILALPWVVNFKATLGVVIAPIWAWTSASNTTHQLEVRAQPEALESVTSENGDTVDFPEAR
jgi:hypothetical protein